jgi:hypothetical protein
MKKPKIKINNPGMKLSIGERVVNLDAELSLVDAKTLIEQYPESNYVEIIDPKQAGNGTEDKN